MQKSSGWHRLKHRLDEDSGSDVTSSCIEFFFFRNDRFIFTAKFAHLHN